MLALLKKCMYFLVCILLIYVIGRYLRIVDIFIWTFHISMPVILAFIFRFIVDPIIGYFDKIPRKAVCIILYLTIIALFFALLYLVIPGVIEQCMNIYTNYDVTNMQQYIHPYFKPLYDFLLSIHIFDILIEMLQTAIQGIMYWGGNILIAFGISFYLVFDEVRMCHLLERSKLPYKEKVIETLMQLKEMTYAFFKANFLDFLVFFTGSYLVLYFVGLEYLVYIAFFLAITNLIPYIGPFIGGIPVMVYAFSIDTSTGYMCILAILVLQIIESSFIQPMLFKKCLATNPIILIIALSIFGDLFGIMGMLITPLLLAYLAIIKKAIIVENTK